MIVRMGEISSANSFRIVVVMSSGPGAYPGWSACSSFVTPGSVMSTLSRTGNWLGGIPHLAANSSLV